MVFYTLQAMADACLRGDESNIRATSRHLFYKATRATQERMTTLRNSGYLKIDIDLIFAVFALGTSAHWIQQSMVGSLLLDNAAELLIHWKLNEEATAIDTFLYASWAQALTYWEMLVGFVAYKPQNVTMESTTADFTQEFNSTKWWINWPTVRSEGTRPNAWCGLSCEVIELLRLVLDICRKHLTHRSTNGAIQQTFNESNEIFGSRRAYNIQKALMNLNFEAMICTDELLGYSLETHDINTPMSHLIGIAEAYRRASLLQLYLAFDHLEVKQMQGTDAVFRVVENRRHELAAFAIGILRTLDSIPMSSGSKCIQHVLYITAASGLILDKRSAAQAAPGPASFLTFQRVDTAGISDCQMGLSCSMAEFNSEVYRAREYILSRLSTLQELLPSRPVKIAKELVVAIWEKYDSEASCCHLTHWLDIMMDTGLQTLFK